VLRLGQVRAYSVECSIVSDVQQNRMIQKLEHAIEAGHSVLIENMGEQIDAVLKYVLELRLYH